MHLLELCSLLSVLMLMSIVAEGAYVVGKCMIYGVNGELVNCYKLETGRFAGGIIYIFFLFHIETAEMVNERVGSAGKLT